MLISLRKLRIGTLSTKWEDIKSEQINDFIISLLKKHNSGNKVEYVEKQINWEAGSQKESKTQLMPKQSSNKSGIAQKLYMKIKRKRIRK